MSSFGDKLEKAFSNAMHRASEDFWATDLLRTGIPSIDYALGGGFGYGRLSELFGSWSSGKTMVLYYALAENQRNKGVSILFEAEGAFSREFYARLGGDPETLYVYPLDTVEEFYDGIMKICAVSEEGIPLAIGWDSIAATGTKHLMDVGMDKRDMSKAASMSLGTQLITTEVKKHKIAVIATNQTREKIGSMDSATHTPGGKSWPFHASQRVELAFQGGARTSLIMDKDGKTEVGRWIKGKVTKNKLASPFGEFLLPVYVREGFWHPAGYDWGTVLGIDVIESLFYTYTKKYFLPESKVPIVTNAGGWYKLSIEIDPEQKKFRQKEWPDIVVQYPQLRSMVYADYKEMAECSTGEPDPEGEVDQAAD